MIIKKAKDEIQNYLSDASNFKGNCEEVYFLQSKSDIIEIVVKANRDKIPITVSGNGTGLAGGRVPLEGAVLSTDKLNKIIEINESKKFATVQPGVLLRDLQSELEKHNLYYPPDPTEQDCYIGGTVATNASGAKTFKYGPTRNFIQALKIILPNGDSLTLERGKVKAVKNKLELETDNGKKIKLTLPDYKMPAVKNAAGYFCKPDMDAIDLFIGSEGTLGIIYEIKLKLLSKPENILSGVIFFDLEKKGLQFISEARDLSRNFNDSGIDALGLEFFDFHSLSFLKSDYPNIPANADCAVWFEQEISTESESESVQNWIDLINNFYGDLENSWIAQNENDRKNFHEFRHAVSWKVNEFIASKNLTKVGTDVAVPDSEFIEFYFEVKSLVSSSGLNFLTYGHFGNSHLHLNMLPENKNEHKLAKDIYFKICEKAVKLGGTISAEHGIGKLKRDYLLMMFGESAIKQMAELKKQLDSNCILGIGNLFDPEYLK